MQHYIIETPTDFENLRTYVKDNSFPIVAFDIETDSVNEIQANIYGVGLAFQDDEAFYIPIRKRDGSYWWPIEMDIIEWISSVCKSKKLIGHNIVYDVTVWRHRYDIDLTPYIFADTILMKHMVDEEQPFGLKEVAVKYLGSWANEAQLDLYESIKKNGGSTTKTNMQMFMADTEILGKYCAHDCMLTYKLFNKFQPRLEKEGLLKLFYEEEVMPLYREVTIPMKYNGISIDVEHFNKIKGEISLKLRGLEESLYSKIKDLIWKFEYSILQEEFPVKRTGNFPKKVAKMVGLEITSLAKKVIDGIEPSTEAQQVFKQWLLEDGPCPVDTLEVQNSLYFDKYPDRHTVFNFKSRDHLRHLFLDVLGEEAISETEGGDAKIDDEFLQEMSKKYDWVSILRDINTLNKIESTYIEGILERTFNGKLYTSFIQFGTTSGRFASRSPNLQNWPAPQRSNIEGKSEEEIKHLKSMDYFVNSIRHGIVARPGYKLVSSDVVSLEPHLSAYVSQDKYLMDIFIKGLDFYSAIAIKQFNLNEYSADKTAENYLGAKRKDIRDRTKSYSLSIFYGSTAPRISQMLNCSKEEAQTLLDSYLEAFPGVQNFIKECHNSVNRNGYIKTKFGRVRHLIDGKMLYDKYGENLKDYVWAQKRGLLDERKIYRNLLNNSTNMPIQGLGAHVINRASIAIARAFKLELIDGNICMNIHDQIVCEVKEAQAIRAKEIIEHSIERAIDISPIKLKAESIIANTFGECK